MPPSLSKKIDFAVVFSESNVNVESLYKGIRKNHPGLPLCPSEDLTLSEVSQFAAVGIKSPDGSYYSATVQLAVWLSAGLEKVR